VIASEPLNYKALAAEITREAARWKKIVQSARG